ncbi:MAG: hypothetical protein AAFN13_10810, partial [Bacteroidota bacterium]
MPQPPSDSARVADSLDAVRESIGVADGGGVRSPTDLGGDVADALAEAVGLGPAITRDLLLTLLLAV